MAWFYGHNWSEDWPGIYQNQDARINRENLQISSVRNEITNLKCLLFSSEPVLSSLTTRFTSKCFNLEFEDVTSPCSCKMHPTKIICQILHCLNIISHNPNCQMQDLKFSCCISGSKQPLLNLQFWIQPRPYVFSMLYGKMHIAQNYWVWGSKVFSWAKAKFLG